MNQIAAEVDLDSKVRIVIARAVAALRVEVISPLVGQNEGIANTDVRKAQGKFGRTRRRRG